MKFFPPKVILLNKNTKEITLIFYPLYFTETRLDRWWQSQRDKYTKSRKPTQSGQAAPKPNPRTQYVINRLRFLRGHIVTKNTPKQTLLPPHQPRSADSFVVDGQQASTSQPSGTTADPQPGTSGIKRPHTSRQHPPFPQSSDDDDDLLVSFVFSRKIKVNVLEIIFSKFNLFFV